MELELTSLLFWLKKALAVAALPPLMPLLPIVAGLLLLERRPRLGRCFAWAGVVLSLALVTPASVNWLVARVEYPHALAPGAAQDAEAIVVLGAGRRKHAPEFGGDTVNRLALERLRYAARLARETGLPVLVAENPLTCVARGGGKVLELIGQRNNTLFADE